MQYQMGTMTQTYEIGECPLSVDGACDSDGECPYGCDAKMRVQTEAEQAREDEHLACDQVFVLIRLLAAEGWIKRFAGLNMTPEPLLLRHRERHEHVRKYATPWVLAEFERHWPMYWPDFAHRGIECFRDWEATLYQAYHPISQDLS